MSDEYEYGPWIGWNGGERPVAASAMVQTCLRRWGEKETTSAGSLRWGHSQVAPGADIIAYRIATPKPKREFVVGKWYRPLVSGRWQRCIAIEGEMAWLVQPSNHPFAHPWEEGEINWAVSPRDEAPE